MSLKTITFFKRFEKDILSLKKTITIRDEKEKDYEINSIVEVSTFEENRFFCFIKIKKVEAILFENLNDFHAKQENMTLIDLKNIILEIYPKAKNLYVISYEVIKK